MLFRSLTLRFVNAPSGLIIQMPGPGKWQRKFRFPKFPFSRWTCRGSFSSVSTLLIARVGACFSIFQDLQDCYTFAPLQCKFLRDFASFLWNFRILRNFADLSANRAFFAANFTEFCRNCEKLESEIFPFRRGKGKMEGTGKKENEIKCQEKGNGRAPNLN